MSSIPGSVAQTSEGVSEPPAQVAGPVLSLR